MPAGRPPGLRHHRRAPWCGSEVEARPDTPYEQWPGWPPQAAYLPRYEVRVE